MRQYLQLLKHIKENGIPKGDRTGTGTLSVFGYQMRFDLERGLPLVTTKQVHVKSVIYELLWFLKGDTNIKYLVDNGVSIWTDWPLKRFNYHSENEYGLPPEPRTMFEQRIRDNEAFALQWGNIGPMYGAQWRSWPKYGPGRGYIDQLDNVIKEIQNNPNSRRLIVSAWNVAELDQMALNPCHMMFQFYVVEGRLSCQVYIRSSDVFLGLPFNIASYALLTAMVAQVCDLHVGELIVTLGDAHIYSNHMEQVELQLQRVPRPLPILYLNDQVKAIDDFKYEDFYIEGYDPHPAIKAPVAV